MPIFVSHQPSMQLLAQAGYTAGAGQFMQQQRQMAQQERMQMRAIEADRLAQERQIQASIGRAAMGIQANMMSQRQAQKARADLEMDDRKFAEQQQRLDHDNRVDLLKMQRQNAFDVENMKAGNDFAIDLAGGFTAAWQNHLEEIDKLIADGASYGEDEEKKKARIDALQAVEKIQRDQTMEPVQKAQAIFQKIMQIPIPEFPQQTIQDQIKQVEIGGKTYDAFLNSKGEPQIIEAAEDDPYEGLSFQERVKVDPDMNRDYYDLAKEIAKLEAEGGDEPRPVSWSRVQEIFKGLLQSGPQPDQSLPPAPAMPEPMPMDTPIRKKRVKVTKGAKGLQFSEVSP